MHGIIYIRFRNEDGYMVEVEKLSIFNIDIFRELYDGKDNSYICDKTFFEAYDNEPFIVKFILRKQVKLFKLNEKYIGYIWHEYPASKNLPCNIYSLYVKEEYIDCIKPEFLDSLNIDSFKIDIRDNPKNLELIKKLNFTLLSETLLMKILDANCKILFLIIKTESHYQCQIYWLKKKRNTIWMIFACLLQLIHAHL